MRLLVTFALLAGAGCYSPQYGDCQVSCAMNGLCPEGLECDGVACRAPGVTGACTSADAALDAAVGLPIDAVPSAQAQALCTYYQGCGAFGTVAECMAIIEPGTINSSPILTAAQTAGTLIYNEAKALECTAGLAALGCTRDVAPLTGDGRAIPFACYEMYTGTIASGMPCTLSETCTSQRCDKPICQPESCCAGVCADGPAPSVRAQNESCTEQDRCTGGFCDPAVKPSFCLPYRADNDPCTRNAECMPGSNCRISGGTMVCARLSPKDGPCDATSMCLNVNDVCTNGMCAPGSVDGETCDLASNACHPFHACIGSTCELPPVVDEPCGAFPTCTNARCVNGQCVEKLADEQPCSASNQGSDCQSNVCGSNQTCAPRPVCI